MFPRDSTTGSPLDNAYYAFFSCFPGAQAIERVRAD